MCKGAYEMCSCKMKSFRLKERIVKGLMIFWLLKERKI